MDFNQVCGQVTESKSCLIDFSAKQHPKQDPKSFLSILEPEIKRQKTAMTEDWKCGLSYNVKPAEAATAVSVLGIPSFTTADCITCSLILQWTETIGDALPSVTSSKASMKNYGSKIVDRMMDVGSISMTARDILDEKLNITLDTTHLSNIDGKICSI